MDMNRPAMFLEAINQVLQIWTSKPPYNIQGQFWNISTAAAMTAPYTSRYALQTSRSL